MGGKNASQEKLTKARVVIVPWAPCAFPASLRSCVLLSAEAGVIAEPPPDEVRGKDCSPGPRILYTDETTIRPADRGRC